MIISVKDASRCNNVIADKWTPYVELVKQEKSRSKDIVTSDLDIEYIDVDSGKDVEKSIEGKVLDALGLHKYCCRRMLLTFILFPIFKLL